MSKLNFKSVGIPAVILFIICLSVSVLVVLTNSLTIDKIEAHRIEKECSLRKQVLPRAVSFEEMESITGGVKVFKGKGKNGKIVGYVFLTSSKGYGGNIEVMTGIAMNGKITGVKILSDNETPGLGAKAKEGGFLNQYKKNIKEKRLQLTKNNEPNKIQAMTGATITSKAVTVAVNEASDEFNRIKKAGGVR